MQNILLLFLIEKKNEVTERMKEWSNTLVARRRVGTGRVSILRL